MRAYFGARKRLVGLFTSVLAIAIVAFVTTRVSDPILAVSDGSAYTVPLVEDDNPDPDIVETTIVAQPAGVDINTPDGDISVLTFNGTIPGPEFRLKVGDTVIVHFRNEIAHATGIHWHGIELHNAHDGTPLTQNMVEPGDTYLYKFKVTRPGVYWYHPHHHSSTNQVFKGMYGSIIVTDPDEQSLQGTVLPSVADTRTLVFSDLTVCKAVGSNDTRTYPDTLPHVSGATPLPNQANPTPEDLCENSPLDEDSLPRGPYGAGDVPNIQKPGTAGRVNEGQTVLTNGINVGHRDGSPSAPGPVAAGANMLDVTAGQGLRFQMINAATIRFFRLILTDASGAQIPLVRVGGQGGVLDHARVEGNAVTPVPAGTFDWKYTQGEILLDPGDRQDVVITIPAGATPGQVLTMWTQDFERAGPSGNFLNLPTVPVAHFNVVSTGGSYSLAAGAALRASIPGAGVEVLGAATATLLDPGTFTPVKPGNPSPNIQLMNGVNELQVDGHVGEHDFEGVDYTAIDHPPSQRYAAAIGDILQLQTTNTTQSHHPFHLHGFSIQPISLTKTGGPNYTFPYAEYRDNIDVPRGYTLTYRTRLDDRPMADGVTMGGGVGRWVFHCHIFFHAVFGMISEFDVVAADGNEKPNIDANDTLVEGAASDTLTMHGTYHDLDGDAVTLTTSAGSITDDGGGLWTWEQTGATSGFVYVTATDADGLIGQTVFEVKVNGPPVLTVPGPQTGTYSDALTFGISATDPDGDSITLTASGLPASLTFIDNGDGTGTVGGNLTVAPGVYVATFFANDGHNDPVSATVEITVIKETTVLTYTGPTVILNGANATLSGQLLEDDGPPVVGRTVNFTLGAQACSGATNGSGIASCTVAVSSGLGTSIPITANFAGDAFYLPSSDADTAIVFAFPSKGAFVVGNTSAASGGVVEWWGHSWSANNVLSGGASPSAFKGFGLNVTLPTSSPPAVCGVPWTTGPGNSPAPPGTVPAYMGVLVSSSTAKSGASIAGNTTSIVVVAVDPGYAANPGKPGRGTVIATYCP